MDGIDENPIEAHRGGASEMLAPAGKRPGKEGEEVIERHRMGSGSGWDGMAVLRRRGRVAGRVVALAATHCRYGS